MSSLYHRYRPQTYDDVIGQPAAVKVLKSFAGNYPKAMLFVGPSGSGKTTCARILAAEAGAEPPDLVEKNTAVVESPIEMVREIQRDLYGEAMVGTRRMWILDEIQSFSRAKFAQEGLLKILEDAPDPVLFVLCTTDEKKLIPTVRTRCVRVVFNPVAEGPLVDLVTKIALAEGKPLTADLARRIASQAGGSPRLALVELEKILGIPPGDGRDECIEGVRAEKAAFDLARELLYSRGDPSFKNVAVILADIKDEEPEGLRQMLLAAARTTLLKGGPDAPRAYTLIQCLRDPYFDRNSGHALLAADCYKAVSLIGGKK